jgi:hypothetical protein
MHDIGVWDRPGMAAATMAAVPRDPPGLVQGRLLPMTQDTVGYKGSLSLYHQAPLVVTSQLVLS